jgi:agmatinase
MKTLPLERNFLAIEEKFSNLDDSEICIVSAPYEHSVSYGGGTANGPEAIIEASHFVEFYDDETGKELCFERGIATIEPIKFDDKIDESALDLIEEQVNTLLEKKKFVVTLGGEHTISIAPIKAHYKYFPNMCLLHFDAHSDLRESYEDMPYSHASAIARVADFFPTERITQVGIRAQCIEEAEFIKKNNIKTFYASQIRRNPYLWAFWKESVVDTLTDEVYITFDVDYFDPAIMPATGTPEPDGMLYSETIELISMIKAAGKKIIGFDVVELAPMEGLKHPDMLTARLIYKILNLEFYKSITN